MLACIDKISIIGNYLKISNIGLCKFTTLKINMELNCNLVKNT